MMTKLMIAAVALSLLIPAGGTATAQEEPDKKKADPTSLDRGLMPGPPMGRPKLLSKEKLAQKPDPIPVPEDVAAAPDNAQRTSSGLASRVLEPGKGDRPPGPNDMVSIRYTGWKTDGLQFDTTEYKKRPRKFRLDLIITGLSEGLQLMVVGEKRRLWIPEELAYAGRQDGIPGMLVYDVKLIEVFRAPETPPDIAAAPASAVKTDSGLAYLVLASAEGDPPGPQDKVSAHVDSWMPDGTLFDSTRLRDSPTSFQLDQSVPAFHEMIGSMAPGEKRRVWSPAELAQLDEDSSIDTPMVFEIELLQFFSEPAVPREVSVAPRDAHKTMSGLVYRVLRPGTGERRPVQGDTVEVDFAGWTRDGKRFDSSYDRGATGIFTLDHTQPMGWNEILRMMVVGEKRRVWIPRELGFLGKQDKPDAMVVFDLELIAFEDQE